MSSLSVVDMSFCKPLLFHLKHLVGERIFPAELSPLLVTTGKGLSDYCLKEMTRCMPACFEAVKAHVGLQMDMSSCCLCF